MSRALACETGREVLLAVGSPNPDLEQIIRIYPNIDFVMQGKWWWNYRFKNWRQYPHPTNEYEEGWQFADDFSRGGIFWLDSNEFGSACIGPNKDRATDNFPTVARSVTARGFCAARSERFGH
jgi:hypothetical protein